MHYLLKNIKKVAINSCKPGTQVRNFTHVDDIVSGIIRVGLDGRGDGVCIGSDESFSILEIANMFGGEIEMLPERQETECLQICMLKKSKN